MSKYQELFLSESREHLATLSRLLLTLEDVKQDRDTVDALFREAHSVKGMAASMGFQQMADLAHYLEDFLDRFRSGGEILREALDRLFVGCDLLEKLLDDIAADRPERNIQGFVQGKSVEEVSSSQTIAESSVQKLKIAIELAAETAAPAARALLIQTELEHHGKLLEATPGREELLTGPLIRLMELTLETELEVAEVETLLSGMSDIDSAEVSQVVVESEQPRRRREDKEKSVRVRTELLDRLINLTGELITNRYRLHDAHRHNNSREMTAGLEQLRGLLDTLHRDVLQGRLMPLESIVGRIPRLVRAHCRDAGKEIDLHIEGADVELDRAVLEGFGDALVHLVRNAIDHGIEEVGTVQIRAWREQDQVLLEVADDGRGIDPDVVRQKALDKGLLQPQQAARLGVQDTIALICHPGFSTADEVTSTSGRGVGMDVVKATVERVGGNMEIKSKPGEGTRVQLRLPLSAAIIKVLLVSCRPHLVALPISRIVHTLEVEHREIVVSGRQRLVRFAGELVPLLSLRKMLRLEPISPGALVPVAISELRGRMVGLVLDGFIGHREAFVKSLASPLDALPGINGATVLGDGRLVFVIDPQALLDGREFSTSQEQVVNE
ncbi:MAG: hypothetical protein C0616_01655 [Desulfuromonas sp.]|nr:MAG: hypothetical protein C0616_01655 [Desulfuromonas sp.]